MLRILALSFGVLAGATVVVSDAHACACCTNQGQRHVGVEKLDLGKREEIARLRFGADAQMFTGEGDAEDIKGIAKTSGRYRLQVSQGDSRWTFTFQDKAGGSGVLTLAMPATVSVFEVDPRLGEREGGQGPVLYKEWRLTSAAAGTGIFAPGMGAGQRVTLILQGHGNSCTSAYDFSHWTIVVSGPKADYSLFGTLAR